MSLRTLSKHRSEASYAHSHRKFGGCSTKQVKLLRKATKAFNRAVRRAQRDVIAEAVASMERDERIDLPVFGEQVYHAEGHGQYADSVGLWCSHVGEYVMFRDDEGYLYNPSRLAAWS